MLLGDRDTIAAISTAKGVGALSIVRIAGMGSLSIFEACFSSRPNTLESHKAYHGLWSSNQLPIDEVVVLYFSEGKGFTGEESIEIICHGGLEITSLILESCLKAGARLARPGEFTYRAVMNNKMDLVQAEGILGLIQANSPRAAALALNQVRGNLSRTLTTIEKEVIYLLAHLEAAIDFITEDIQPVEYPVMAGRTEILLEKTKTLLSTFLPSQVSRSGVRAVLAGSPNAGKSSLLNALLGLDRSIVHEAPGTTRDTIEAELKLEGLVFRLIDTAGLRSSIDPVESRGICRTHEELKTADIVLYVVDSVMGLSNDDVDVIKAAGKDKALICFNKIDLNGKSLIDEIKKFGLSDFIFVSSSTLSFEGTREVLNKLSALGQNKSLGSEVDEAISSQRQFDFIKTANLNLYEALDLLRQNASPDLISFSFREALQDIQKALGKNVGDEVMDLVFKEFCIGK